MAKDFPELVLYDPRDNPVRGIFSYPDPSALVIGEWAQLTNVRVRQRSILVRNGYDDLFAFGSAGTFRGAGVLQLKSQSNNPFYLAGLNVSSKGEIWGTNTGSGITKRSAESGQYGDTRFDNGTSYYTFAPLNAKGAFGLYTTDGVAVIQDGAGYPRVYDSSTLISGSGHTAIHRPITPPSTTSNLKTVPTFPVYFPVNDPATTTYADDNGGVRLYGADGGTTPASWVRVRTGTGANAVQNGDDMTVTFNATKDLSASRQFVMFVDDVSATLDVDFWSNIKIELGEGGVFTTIYDGQTAANSAVTQYQPDVTDSTRYWLAFQLDSIADASLNAVDGIKFTWTGSTRAAGIGVTDLSIFLMAGSGKVQGGALHGISYFNSGTWAESPGLVIVNVEPEYIRNLGGYKATATAADSNLQVPDTPLIYVNYNVQFQNTDATEMGRGVDTLRIYRKDQLYDPETGQWSLERDWGHTEDKVIATYSASWAFSSGSAGSVVSHEDDIDVYAKDYRLPFPPGTHLPIPIGSAMCAANGRLFVAGFRDTVSDARDTLWISQKNQTSRFDRLTRFKDGVPEEGSPTSIRFPGEIIQAIVASSTSTFGQSQVYVITDKTTYALREPFFSVHKIGDVGTLSQFSVAENRGRIFFLDSDAIVRRLYNGQFDDLSSGSVDNKLKAIPDAERYYVSGVYWRDSYRLAYAPSSGANTQCLIWDEVMNDGNGGWLSDSISVGAEQMILWRTATGLPKLCFFSAEATPSMYEHEQDSQTDDNGTAIAITLTTGELHNEDWSKIFPRKGTAIVDDNASGTLTWTWTYPHTGNTSVATMSIDVSTTQAWRQTGQPTITGAQGGPTAQLSITGNMLGGKKIKLLKTEIEGMDAGPDR